MSETPLYEPPAQQRRETRPPLGPDAPLRLLALTPRPDEALLPTRTLTSARPRRLKWETVTRMRDAVRLLRLDRHDAMLVDARALRAGGLRVLERLSALAGATPVLLLADAADSADAVAAVEAVRRGAQDVLLRDTLSPERLATAVTCAIERQRRVIELRDLSLTDPLTGLHNRRGFRALAEANL